MCIVLSFDRDPFLELRSVQCTSCDAAGVVGLPSGADCTDPQRSAAAAGARIDIQFGHSGSLEFGV